MPPRRQGFRFSGNRQICFASDHLFHASAASPVVSLISTDGCSARICQVSAADGCRQRSPSRRYVFTRERRPLLVDGVAQLLILHSVCWAKTRSSSPASVSVTVRYHAQTAADRDLLLGAVFVAKRRRANVHCPRATAKMAAFRRCRKVFRSRKSNGAALNVDVQKLQCDVVNISISAINFLSIVNSISQTRTEQ